MPNTVADTKNAETDVVEKVQRPDSSAKEPDNTKKVKAAKGLIQVRALRDGFYGGLRRAEGDVFGVAKTEHLGSWMQCLDPAAEAAHRQQMEAKSKSAGK